MGKAEAIEDGIEFYDDPNDPDLGYLGKTIYLVPCSVCGNKKKVVKYGRNVNYVCDVCKAKKEYAKKKIADSWFEVIEEKGERRYNKALDNIQSQVKNFKPYERAAEIARKAQGKYGSVPEAMVAVELARLGYAFVPQQKIGRYRVDFYIPKIPMIIEVDGEVFHHKRTNREAEIQIMVGFETKMLSVPAELIEKDIQKLGDLIKKRIDMP